MIILIDDLRSFADGRDCLTARTSTAGVEVLRWAIEQGMEIEELWLDHDLGGLDEIWPVISFMEAHADVLNVGTVYIHTSNPGGATRMRIALEAQGYNVSRAPIDRDTWVWIPPDELRAGR